MKKNSWAKTRKPRFSVVFHRPKTLKRTRDPKYTRKRCGPGGRGGRWPDARSVVQLRAGGSSCPAVRAWPQRGWRSLRGDACVAALTVWQRPA